MKKIRKNRMLNILIIGMGTFIFVEVFLFTAVTIFIAHCLGIKEKKVYTISIEISGKTTWNNVKR